MNLDITAKTVIDGRFEIDRIAGSGGMGIVYRAHDRRTGEPVALKVLHSATNSQVEPRRFSREARILANLHHPGIASFIASGQTPDGLSYLVMEWLQGEDLSQRLDRGPLSPEQGRQLLQQVAEALAYAHPLGIVHRDIKPSNLFLCNHQLQRVVLLDFGVAHYKERITQSVLTQTGTVVGTLAYMSPEQARAEPVITPAADIYSLGRVVHNALSGHTRHEPEHVVSALTKVLFTDSPPLVQTCPQVPVALSDLVGRMLAKAAALLGGAHMY